PLEGLPDFIVHPRPLEQFPNVHATASVPPSGLLGLVQRLPRRPLHRAPGRRRLRCPCGLQRLVAAMPLVEDRDPLARAVIAETDLVPMLLHPRDDVADAAPRVEPPVQESKLGLAGI